MFMRELFMVAALTSGASSAMADGRAADRRCDLLIVAPAQFRESLAGFVAHKRDQMGLATELAILEEILDAPHDQKVARKEVTTPVPPQEPMDDPERLKRFIYEAWTNRGARYVLLVGDADVMPVRYMVLDRITEAAFDYAFYPSDLYYADLAKADGSFEDWNGSREGFHARYFGEVRGEKNKADPINFDAIDYKPEIAVGRWPASTIEDVESIAAKTIAYESARQRAAKPQAALLACGGWIENRSMMDSIAATMDASWSIEKRYFHDDSRHDTPPADETGVIALMNGGCQLILHSGHGADDRWEGSISTASIALLTNAQHPAVLMSAGCSTARFASLGPYEPYEDIHGVKHAGTNHGEIFTEPPPPPASYQREEFNHSGLGEQLLRTPATGAVAYIGCNTGSQPCGMTLMHGFAAALAHDPSIRLGDAWTAALNHYWNHESLATIQPNESWYPASIFFQGMKFMVFGDPSIRPACVDLDHQQPSR
jgi:hypothetical protein